MTTQKVSELVVQLRRHPLVIDAVRVASAAVVGDAELVVFAEQRALVVGGLSLSILQPRALTGAEQLVRAGASESVTPSASAVVLRDVDGEPVGALTVDVAVDESQLAVLHGVCRMITQQLAALSSAEQEETDRSTAVLRGLRDLVVVIDESFEILWCNTALSSLLGWSPQEFVGKSAFDFIHTDDLAALDATVRLKDGHEVYRVSLRLRHAGEYYQPVVITAMDQSHDPAVGGIVLSVRSDDRRAEVERQLEQAQGVSSAIVQDLTDAVIAADAAGAIRLINTAARQLFGIDEATPAPSVTVVDLPLLDEAGQPLPAAEHPLAAGGNDDLRGRRHYVDSPRGLRHVTTFVRPVCVGDAEIGVVLTVHDDTDARAADAALEARAFQDELTGLANRRRLDELLAEMAKAPGTGEVAALFLDLDGFKVVNDVHGHRTGDQLLQMAATRLQDQLRSGDHLARHGGDEFVVLIPGVPSTDVALAIAENLRRVLGESFEIEGSRFYLTASVGVTVESTRRLDSDSLLQRADIALYVAKSAGGNRVSLFNEEVAAAVEVAQSHRELIREVLEDGSLVMQFQPVVDSYTGRLVAVEALARCRQDDGSFFAPGRFLSSIGGTSLMVDLDKRAFDLSCRAAKRLAMVRPDRPLSVACNFSGATLMQSDLVEMVMNIVNSNGVDPAQICIEVTESTAFDVGDSSVDALRQLREAGFRVALDDFGTGYSSLSHLRDLPLSLVKVDRSFISKLVAGSPELAIARAIVRLADDLGLDTVAEGVETAEQLAAARAVGFRSIQGWYYSHAVDIEQIVEMLDESVRDGA